MANSTLLDVQDKPTTPPPDCLCECADPGCPIHPGCPCDCGATTIVYRIDMDDTAGTAMCERCAEDALDSGVFSEGSTT